VLLIRRIRELLYEQGFTISGARNKLDSRAAHQHADEADVLDNFVAEPPLDPAMIRTELQAILSLLK